MIEENEKKEGFYFLVKAEGNSRNRYSYRDKVLVLEDVLPEEIKYPEDYGIVSRTASETGEPLGGFLITNESMEPGSFVKVKPIAIIRTENDKIRDDKIVVVPLEDPNLKDVESLEDIEREILPDLEKFIQDKAKIEGKNMEIEDCLGAEKANQLIEHCRKIYKRKNK